MNRKATGVIDQWMPLAELAELFGLSEESIKRFAKKNGFPLRRLTPYATPGVLESELFSWLKAQPPVGPAVRASRVTRSRDFLSPQTSPLNSSNQLTAHDRGIDSGSRPVICRAP